MNTEEAWSLVAYQIWVVFYHIAPPLLFYAAGRIDRERGWIFDSILMFIGTIFYILVVRH